MEEGKQGIDKMPKIVASRIVRDTTFGCYRLIDAPEELNLMPKDLDDATKDMLLSGAFVVYALLAIFAYYGCSSNPAYRAIYDIILIITVYVFILKVMWLNAVNKMVVYHINCIKSTNDICYYIEMAFVVTVMLRFLTMFIDMILMK